MDNSTIETGREFDNPMSMPAVSSLGVADTANIRTSPNNKMPIQARLLQLQMRTYVAAYPQHLLLLRNTLLFVSDNDNDAPTSEFTAPIQTHNPLMHYEPDESSKGDKENAIAEI